MEGHDPPEQCPDDGSRRRAAQIKRGTGVQLNIISADNHVMEPPGTFVDRVPTALKERVPRFVKALDGGEGWSWDGTPPASSPVPNTMGTGGTGWTWGQIPAGNCDGSAHLEDMAQDG